MNQRRAPTVFNSFNYAIEGIIHVLRTQRNMRIHVVIALVVVVFALIGFVPAVHAQQGRGTIVGTVTDASGASVKGARVSILNVDTNNPVNTETNTEGFFNSPPLIVGAGWPIFM